MMPFEFICAGERLQALPAGALHWPAKRLLAVADLHLEKGSSYAVSARKLLPRHDTRQTLAMLTALVDVLAPQTVVCLGDSFHDRKAVDRLPDMERWQIEQLTARARFVWIAGNHDPAPPQEGWGDVAEEINDGPLVFRHEARFGPAIGEISGHFHPVAALTPSAKQPSVSTKASSRLSFWGSSNGKSWAATIPMRTPRIWRGQRCLCIAAV